MKNIFLFLTLLFLTGFMGCKKYLAAKSDKSLAIPTTVEELQALMDFNTIMNFQHPSIGESSADDYFITQDAVTAMTPIQKNLYLWDTAAYGTFPNDWAKCYQPIYQANLVLAHIDNIKRNAANANSWNNAKGSALFFRGRYFLTALSYWAKSYNANTSDIDLGIPLRSTDDFNIPSVRSSVTDGYRQVIYDLKQAAALLPDLPTHVIRPSKAAAYALIAWTYLMMRQYDSCLKYSGLALSIKNTLIDYNTLSTTSAFPLPRYNAEVIFDSYINVYSHLQRGRIDTILYKSFHADDLRKVLFFKKETDGLYSFRGSYDGDRLPFSGLATDEVWLMHAESSVVVGNMQQGRDDLNTLLRKRFKPGAYQEITETGKEALLQIIRQERRKELVFRDIRWADMKRQNMEGAGIRIKRILDEQTFELLPNANRFALPLPLDLVTSTGMPQNPY